MMYGPDPTPFSDWWKTRHRPRQHPRIADDQYRLSGKSVVQGLLGMLPGVGEAMDAWDVGAGLLQKDPKRVGAGLLGAALPFVTGRALRGAVDDLPMDEASRMARAREMGFDVERPMYHGTVSQDGLDFDAFDPAMRGSATEADDAYLAEFFAERPDLANMFTWSGGEPDGGMVIKALSRGNYKEVDAPYFSQRDWVRHIEQARRDGYDGVRFNMAEPNGPVVANFYPEKLRSPFARFDPRNADSADLLAGLSGLGLLGAYRAQRER